MQMRPNSGIKENEDAIKYAMSELISRIQTASKNQNILHNQIFLAYQNDAPSCIAFKIPITYVDAPTSLSKQTMQIALLHLLLNDLPAA